MAERESGGAAGGAQTLTFLGTSASCGVPSFFCHCAACEAARRDPSKRRGCSGILLQGDGTVLVDAPPDLRSQLIREGVEGVDEVFLTHAHYDHMGGFGELELFVRVHRDSPLPFHGSQFALSECFKEFGYMDDCFDAEPMEAFETREAAGMSIQALPLVHVSGTFGYLVTAASGGRTFYAPDTGLLKPEVAELLHGVDNLIMDATYWGENPRPKRHRSVQQTVALGLEELDAKRVYLQHLAPHMGGEEDWIARMEEYAESFGGRVVVPSDGMRIVL